MRLSLCVLALLCLTHGVAGARIHKTASEDAQKVESVHRFHRSLAEEPEEVKECRTKITKDEIAQCMCNSVNGKDLSAEDLADACANVKAETQKMATQWSCAVRVTAKDSRCIRVDTENDSIEKDEDEPAQDEEEGEALPESQFLSVGMKLRKEKGNKQDKAKKVCSLAHGKGADVKARCNSRKLKMAAMFAANPWDCAPLQTAGGVTRCLPRHPFRKTPESKPVDVIPDGGNTNIVEERQNDEDDPKNDAGGDLLEDDLDLEEEEEFEDPVDCVGTWTTGTCDKACGGGKKTKTFTITTQPAHGGQACPADEEEDCNEDPCPVDCVGSYTKWSECSADCGGGTQSRDFEVSTPAEHGGKACPDDESKNCNERPCPVDCEGEWGQFEPCSKSCGGGEQTRTFSVTTPAAHGGAACPASLEETQTCNSNSCPVNCVGEWGEWGECTEPCDGGSQERSFSVSTPAAFGGVACPQSPESKDCNTHDCPVHCDGSWGAWGECTAKCGGGTQTRVWMTSTAAANGGKQCPASPATRKCNDQPCPQDCVYTWGGWNQCSKPCGGGTQTRAIVVHAQDAHGGKACPASPINQACNTHVCPVDCQATLKGWGACSKKCGGGTQTQLWHITKQQVGAGKACPIPTTQACNTHACPVNCAYGWSGWSGCSKACGGGSQSRSIKIQIAAAHGGRACPSSPETKSCNNHACWCGHFQTSFNNDGGGNAVYLDRHAPNCGNRKMSRWKLVRDHWHRNIRILFTCCDTPNSGGCGWRSTRYNDDGDGESVYLDRHDVRCNHGEGLSYWRLARGSGGSGWGARRRTIKFDYKCCHVPGIGNCRSISTWLNSDGGSNTVYFDRHDLDCHRYGKTVMTRWHLNRAGTHNRIRFDYTCCDHR